MQELAIGIGLFVNLVMVEITGFTAGGMVVPGYVSIALDSPLRVAASITIAFLTYVTVQLLSLTVILYGRRLLTFSILFGFLYSRIYDYSVGYYGGRYEALHLRAVGIIVPGLLAYWMARQGVVASVCGLLIGSIITRLILVMIFGTTV